MMESNAEEKQGNPKRTHPHTHTHTHKKSKTKQNREMLHDDGLYYYYYVNIAEL